MKKIFLLVIIFSTPFIIKAQYSVDTNLTVNQYVEKLLGPGIAFSNAHIYGDRQAIGYFTGAGDMLSIQRGILLTTGYAAKTNDLVALQQNGDDNNGLSAIPELDSMGGIDTRDGLIFQFDFVPQSNLISFQYIFASQEYNEFVCSQFNDAVAIFLSGPGIVGEQNLAVVPISGEPISVNTVNNGNFIDTSNGFCTGENAEYFDSIVPPNLIFDGYTVKMNAFAEVLPCVNYTLRFIIADVGDDIYDSAIFLKGLTESTNIGITAVINDEDQLIYEDCSSLKLTFHNTDTLSSDYVFHYSLSGTAENGMDYTTIPDSVIILAGTNTTDIYLSVFQDNQNEGIETITFTYQTVCGDFISEFQISDLPALEIVQDPIEVVCAGKGPIQLSANLIQGVPPYTYSWKNSFSSESFLSVNPLVETMYRLYVTDRCGTTDSTDFIVPVFPLPEPITLYYTSSNSSIWFDEPVSNDSIFWVFNEASKQLITNPNLTLSSTGSYSVYRVDSNGCSSISNAILFDSNSSTSELFLIYPSPAKDNLSIALVDVSIFEIYDLAGRLIRNQVLLEGIQTISVADIPQGIYLVRIQNSSGTGTAKIFITH